jgi:hypothetical protein
MLTLLLFHHLAIEASVGSGFLPFPSVGGRSIVSKVGRFIVLGALPSKIFIHH